MMGSRSRSRRYSPTEDRRSASCTVSSIDGRNPQAGCSLGRWHGWCHRELRPSCPFRGCWSGGSCTGSIRRAISPGSFRPSWDSLSRKRCGQNHGCLARQGGSVRPEFHPSSAAVNSSEDVRCSSMMYARRVRRFRGQRVRSGTRGSRHWLRQPRVAWRERSTTPAPGGGVTRTPVFGKRTPGVAVMSVRSSPTPLRRVPASGGAHLRREIT